MTPVSWILGPLSPFSGQDYRLILPEDGAGGTVEVLRSVAASAGPTTCRDIFFATLNWQIILKKSLNRPIFSR